MAAQLCSGRLRAPAAAALPALDRVCVDGHRKTDSALWRERLGGVPQFELTGGKTDAWLAANFDNPFRDWIDRNARTGTLAAAAWRKARAALPSPKAEKTLRVFVDTFTKIAEDHGIDTIDREEVFEAFARSPQRATCPRRPRKSGSASGAIFRARCFG